MVVVTPPSTATTAVPFETVWARLPCLVFPELHMLFERRNPKLFAVLPNACFSEIVLQAADHISQDAQVSRFALGSTCVGTSLICTLFHDAKTCCASSRLECRDLTGPRHWTLTTAAAAAAAAATNIRGWCMGAETGQWVVLRTHGIGPSIYRSCSFQVFNRHRL